ncbi:hypothetical protein [Actinotalea solisilvae]|uniref:hypothetical protein n=1 Tax=Actinotalea solisilvae TaxID=2072922 RepID=UPI0018F21EB6|nr:hypothetical protein [Actinotalea solisilvae]
MTAVADEPDLLDRAARARAALARAEERTGTSGWVRPVRARGAEALVRARGTTTTLPVLAPARPSPEVELSDPEAPERLLAVPDALAGLLPLGALQRGSTVVVAGSTSLVLGLLAEASRAGSWVALVGLPGVGVLAAHELGIALDRVVLVPDPGADGPTVVAALLDGVDVVVVGPGAALADGDRRRLSARARERSSVLLPTTPWPGAHVVLTARSEEWEGLGRGHGRLRSRRLVVERQGRGSAAQPVRAQVHLPADARAVAERRAEAVPVLEVVGAPGGLGAPGTSTTSDVPGAAGVRRAG